MARRITLALAAFGVCANAQADVWKWVDEVGDSHFVTSNRPIYTWFDGGEVYFSDKPEHPDAKGVELVWHSSGTLSDVDVEGASSDPNAVPGETQAQAAERRAAEAYYCSQASEILETYKSAPQLYRTVENGERQYLSGDETAEAIAEAQAGVDEFCH